MSTTSIIDFCNLHGIAWFPINLKITKTNETKHGEPKYKKEFQPIQHVSYGSTGMAKCTDFKTLTPDQIKKRQELIFNDAYNFNSIALDTSRVFHIDFDLPMNLINEQERAKFENITTLTPYFKSSTKSYGIHAFITTDADVKGRKKLYDGGVNGDVELLSGEWSYAPIDAVVENADDDILHFDKKAFADYYTEPERRTIPTSVTENVDVDGQTLSVDEATKLFQCLSKNRALPYNDWINVFLATRNSTMANAVEIADLFAKWSRVGQYDTDMTESDNKYKFLDAFPSTITGCLTKKSLHYWAIQDNKELHTQLFPREPTRFLSKEIAKYMASNPTIHFDEQDELATHFFNVSKGFICINTTEELCIYMNDVWMSGKQADEVLRFAMAEVFKQFVNIALTSLNQKITLTSEPKKLDELKEEYGSVIKAKKNILTDRFIKASVSIYRAKLQVSPRIRFDTADEYDYHIQFKNGVFDLKLGQFRSRTQNDHITRILDWDYNPNVSTQVSDYVADIFRKIHPNETERAFALSYLYYALTGNTTQQIFKINWGATAANGKSTELGIHAKCFPIYSLKINGEVLNVGFAKRHKALARMINEPVRLLYLEELNPRRLDSEFLKDIVDGKAFSIEKMYDTDASIKCKAKGCAATNHEPNVDNDEGLKRRMRVQEYSSRFLDGVQDNYEENVFSRDLDVYDHFTDDEYKNAYFQYLLQFSILQVPTSAKKLFEEIAEDNDENVEKFSCIKITKNENDKLTRHECNMAFGETAFKELKTYLAKKGVKYQSQVSSKVNGKVVRGAFFGIKIVTEQHDDPEYGNTNDELIEQE